MFTMTTIPTKEEDAAETCLLHRHHHLCLCRPLDRRHLVVKVKLAEGKVRENDMRPL